MKLPRRTLLHLAAGAAVLPACVCDRKHRIRADRIQVAVRRAFLAAGSDKLTTSQVYDYALPRVRADLWRQMQRCSVLRVLDQLCHRVGRAPTIGRPWL